LFDQEAKIERSGLSAFFESVEVVSEKSPESYARLLKQHHIAPGRFLMVGNSSLSDILPVLALGGSAVYVPYSSTWALDFAEPPPDGTQHYYRIEHLGLLPMLIGEIEKET
jgi:putative hydrolase of the HAD superfamily